MIGLPIEVLNVAEQYRAWSVLANPPLDSIFAWSVLECCFQVGGAPSQLRLPIVLQSLQFHLLIVLPCRASSQFRLPVVRVCACLFFLGGTEFEFDGGS